jgi:hypothetical protein
MSFFAQNRMLGKLTMNGFRDGMFRFDIGIRNQVERFLRADFDTIAPPARAAATAICISVDPKNGRITLLSLCF